MLGGVILFSFCLLLQNQTLTTSFSSWRLSARLVISCAEGFGFLLKCCSRAPLIETSMLVLFFRFRPWAAICKIRKGKKCHNTILRKHLYFLTRVSNGPKLMFSFSGGKSQFNIGFGRITRLRLTMLYYHIFLT